MDILDILLDILLKPPQPFIGLFLYFDISNPIADFFTSFLGSSSGTFLIIVSVFFYILWTDE